MSLFFSVFTLFAAKIIFVKGQANSLIDVGPEEEPILYDNPQFSLRQVVLAHLNSHTKSTGATLLDFDVVGENTARPRNYSRGAITALASEVTMLDVEKTSRKRVDAHTELVHNEKPVHRPSAVHKTILYQNTYTYTVDKGIETGIKAALFRTGIPEAVADHPELSFRFPPLRGTTTTKTKDVTHQLHQEFKVPPNTTVRVEWTVHAEVMDIPWQADLILTGYFAGYFYKGGKYFWDYFPLGDIIHPELLARAPDEIAFRARGRFRSVSSKHIYVVTKEERYSR